MEAQEAGTEANHDWTVFDIGHVVRALRTDNEATLKRVLRTLHVRWWHASEATMQRFLKRAGVSDKTLKLIPDIARTCAVCREWARPGPSNASHVEIPDAFNQQVECDLVFIHKSIIIHFLDRCTRWHAAKVIPDKNAETLINAIDSVWVQLHGPPKEFIMDGEAGVTANASKQYFLEKGIKLHIRAKDMHARYIERRGKLFRDVIHKIDSEMRSRSHYLPMERIVSEAVFCGNALLTVNGTTPYNAVYGRVPHILPSIDQIETTATAPSGSFLRGVHLLREVSVSAMVEGSAKARLN